MCDRSLTDLGNHEAIAEVELISPGSTTLGSARPAAGARTEAAQSRRAIRPARSIILLRPRLETSTIRR